MGIKERKEKEKEKRRDEIINAAKAVFADKGFRKATMEDIANEAELSPGTLYIYFKNKEELYASLSLSILQYLHIRVEQVSREKNLDPEQKVKALMKVGYEAYEFDPLIINLFHLQSSDTLKNLSPPIMLEISELSSNTLETMAKIFQEGIEKGVFIDRHPVALADIFWSFFSGVILWEVSKTLVKGGKNYLKKTLDIAFEIFIRGVKK